MFGPPPTNVCQRPQRSVTPKSTCILWPGWLRLAVNWAVVVPGLKVTLNGLIWFAWGPMVTKALRMWLNARLWSTLLVTVELVVAVRVTWSVPAAVRVVWTAILGHWLQLAAGGDAAWSRRRI